MAEEGTLGSNALAKVEKAGPIKRLRHAIFGLEPGSHIADVSEFQGNVNWGAYGSARHAAVVRVSSGYGPDLRWGPNRDGARSSCMVRGWYQYLAPRKDIATQANQFCDLVGGLQGSEFVVLDYEDPGFGGDQRAGALAWFATVRARLHTTPNQEWFYSYWPFVAEHFGGGLGWLGGRPAWIAGYSVAAPWWRSQAIAWQHTDGQYGDTQCQPAPGLQRCDCSVYGGTIPQLAAFVGGTAPPQPPQSEEDKEMQAYERLAPGDDAAIPLPVGVKATIEISTDDSGRTAPGVPKGEAVRIAIGGPMAGAVTNQNGWHPLLPHPSDPGLGGDGYVGYLPNGSFVTSSDGTGGTLVVENISPTRAQQLGVDATRFPVTNTVGVSVAYKLS